MSVLLAGNTDVSFPEGWPVTPALNSGNSYLLSGLGRVKDLMSPEEAVFRVRALTSHRVAAVPDALGLLYLLRPGLCWQWRVRLEAPVRVRVANSFQTVTTDELYVAGVRCGPAERGAVLIATDSQPGSDVFLVPYADTVSQETRTDTLTLQYALPTSFSATLP